MLPWPLPSHFDFLRIPELEGPWAPATEMYDKEDKLVVRVELPGMKKEDINVSVLGDTLTISGERSVESEVKQEDYYHCERCYGGFSRTITMPGAVETKNIEATYDNGVLEVTLPKVVETKPKKVEISVK